MSAKYFNGYVFNDENKSVPHYVYFRCEIYTFILFIKKIRNCFKIHEVFLKLEMNHEDVYFDTWRDRKNEWLEYFKNDVM